MIQEIHKGLLRQLGLWVNLTGITVVGKELMFPIMERYKADSHQSDVYR